jgi:hypothetical protein
MKDILGDAFYRAEKAREEAAHRVRDQRAADPEADPETMPFTFAILGFESPPRGLRF